jgi:Family of unknown function (DUF5681)
MSFSDVDHSTRWKKGQSGDPSGLPGKPVGARTAFSQGFLTDLELSWRDGDRRRNVRELNIRATLDRLVKGGYLVGRPIGRTLSNIGSHSVAKTP